MIPSAEQVLERRHLLLPWIYAAGGVIGSFGFIRLVSWISEGIRDFDLFDLEYYMPRVIVGTTFFFFGAAVVSFAPLVSRVILPMPRGPLRCPACNYDLINLVRPLCPECGLQFSDRIVECSKQFAHITRLPRPARKHHLFMQSFYSLAFLWFLIPTVIGGIGVPSAVISLDFFESLVFLFLFVTGALGMIACAIARRASRRTAELERIRGHNTQHEPPSA